MTTQTQQVPSPNVTCILLKDTPEPPFALQQSTYAELSIVVADNGSIDDAVSRNVPPLKTDRSHSSEYLLRNRRTRSTAFQ